MLWICFCKRKNSNDIQSILSSHVETVVLVSRAKGWLMKKAACIQDCPAFSGSAGGSSRLFGYAGEKAEFMEEKQRLFEDFFRHKKANFEKLEAYGFQRIRNVYQYDTDILNSEFRLEIKLGKNSVPDTKLTEIATCEEYVLYKTDAIGEYVGTVRAAVATVLQDIADRCYERAIFKAEQSVKLITYVREKYGDELEYLWEKFPENAVWRRKDTEKWYGALLTVSRRKLGIQSDETVEIIDLRGKPELLENLIDNERYFPGWHMNKKHWYTVILDGTVPLEEIFCKIDESYLLAK